MIWRFNLLILAHLTGKLGTEILNRKNKYWWPHLRAIAVLAWEEEQIGDGCFLFFFSSSMHAGSPGVPVQPLALLEGHHGFRNCSHALMFRSVMVWRGFGDENGGEVSYVEMESQGGGSERRHARWGSSGRAYPLGQGPAAACISSPGSTAAAAPGSCLPLWGRRRPGELGWASLGFGWEGSGGEMVRLSVQKRKKTSNYFLFLFFVFKALLHCFELYVRFKIDTKDTKYSVICLTGIRRST
jgi:hypothetical protein